MNQFNIMEHPRLPFRPMLVTVFRNEQETEEQERRTTCSLLLVLTGVMLFLGGVYLTIWAHRNGSDDPPHNFGVMGPIVTVTGVITLASSIHFYRSIRRANRMQVPTQNVDPEAIPGPVLCNPTPRIPDILESPPSYEQCIEKPPSYSSLPIEQLPSYSSLQSNVPSQVPRSDNPTRY